MMTSGDDTDESLMIRIRDGDHQAFSCLVRRHTDRFYACAVRMGADSAEAEDVVQDAFLKIWARPDIWDAGKGARFTTWFYRVVTNMVRDRVRQRGKLAGPEVLDFYSDSAPGQDVALDVRRRQDGVEAAIQVLPERQRAALNLCFYEGLSNREAAEIMGVRVKALESLLMRAKAGVREALARAGVLDGEGAL